MHPPRRGGRRRGAGHRRRGRPRDDRALSGDPRTGLAGPDDLDAPLALLEEALRPGARTPPDLRANLRSAVGRGDLEVVAAWEDEGSASRLVGVALVAYRQSLSLGGFFASVEEVQVRPGARGRGVGRALLRAVAGRCSARGVSYLEVQTDEDAAGFYAASGFRREGEVVVLSRSVAPFAPWEDGVHP